MERNPPDQQPAELRRPWAHTDRFVPRKVIKPLQAFLDTSIASSMLLLLAVVLAMVWVNSPWRVSYVHLFETEIGIGAGSWHLDGTLHFWINEGLMTLFFLVVGLEIKREVTVGELRAWRAAILPVVAAVGGMAVPALIYLAIAGGGAAGNGWGVPMATDIAFALGALTLAAAYAPPSLKPLLLTLAIVDDIGAILVIALFYSGGVRLLPLEEAVVVVGVIVGLRALHVRWLPVYVLAGVLLWYFTYRSGVHPTLVGVILGLLTPAEAFQRPAAVSEEARRIADDTVDDPEPPDADAPEWLRLAWLSREAVPPLARTEAILLPWTSFVIVPLFALANAGVEVSTTGLRATFGSALALGIVLGLVMGKPLGVMGASLLSVRAGGARLPSDVGWGHIAGMGATAGVGFTMSLFIAQLAFTDPRLLDQAKIAILGASVLAGLVGYAVLRMTPRG
jgi:Na+:H+ antiporter, NhaA family